MGNRKNKSNQQIASDVQADNTQVASNEASQNAAQALAELSSAQNTQETAAQLAKALEQAQKENAEQKALAKVYPSVSLKLADVLHAEKASAEQVKRQFTALFYARGKKDDEWIAGRIKIYMRIAEKKAAKLAAKLARESQSNESTN